MTLHFGESGPLDETLKQYGIPQHMHGAITRYIVDGFPPGDFLEAVLCNDLKGAVERADAENLAALAQWVKWLYGEVPYVCWGSVENVRKWIEGKNARRKYGQDFSSHD